MAIRGILFDKDGTLLDFEATWAPLYRRLAFELAGDDTEKARELLVAGGLDPVSGRVVTGSVLGAGSTIDIVERWFPELHDQAFADMVRWVDEAFRAHGAKNSVLLPEILETLARLEAEGYSLGVATNDGTDAARTALTAVGADRHIAHVYGYDAVATPKPAPDAVRAFAGAVGLAPAEIAVVGDNPHDLQMARAAGAGLAIGVLTGNSAEEDLAPFADAVLAGVAELPGFLRARQSKA